MSSRSKFLLLRRCKNYVLVPDIAERVGLTRTRRVVYHIVGLGFWVAPTGFTLSTFKQEGHLALSSARHDGVGQPLWWKGEPTTVIVDRLKEGLLRFNDDNEWFDTVRRYANRELMRREVLVFDAKKDDLSAIMVCNRSGRPRLYKKCPSKDVHRYIDKAREVSVAQLNTLKEAQRIHIDEVMTFLFECPRLLKEEDIT